MIFFEWNQELTQELKTNEIFYCKTFAASIHKTTPNKLTRDISPRFNSIEKTWRFTENTCITPPPKKDIVLGLENSLSSV
jgi:hypothetical protein